MTSYIIAGSSDSTITEEVEQLANYIKSKYKNIDFRIVIKHPSQWKNFLDYIHRIYGFKQKSNPIIYTLDGKLIGNSQDFKIALTQKFGLPLKAVSNVLIKQLTQYNYKLTEQELKQKQKQKRNKKTLIEKLSKVLDDKYSHRIIKNQKRIYQKVIEEGVLYYVTYVPELRPKVTYKQQLEITIEQKETQQTQIDTQQIALRDYYEPQHSESNRSKKESLLNQRKETQIRKQNELKLESRKELSIRRFSQQKKKEEFKEIKEELKENVIPDQGQYIDQVKDEQNKSEISEIQYKPNQTVEQENQRVSEIYVLENIEKIQVTDFIIKSVSLSNQFKDNYYLILHPKPMISNSFILDIPQIFLNQENQKQQQYYIYKLHQANRPFRIDLSSQQSFSRRLFIDRTNPFTKLDWLKMLKAVYKLNALYIVQVTPQGQTERMGIVKKLLLEQLNITQFQLDLILIDENNYIPVLQQQGICYNNHFRHFHLLTKYESPQSIDDLYRKFNLMMKLSIQKLNQSFNYLLGIGFCMILTNQIMMMSPLVQSYLLFKQHKLYPFPFCYYTIFHLPLFKKNEVDKNQLEIGSLQPTKILRKCSGLIQLLQ